ncbi:YciI family protein [Kribbella sp. NBC_01245]|uniref:YciI family protein n=1 Tax=Kribbella sp. NBC_01245 TaxID=2903578 RepID=UPI002E2C48BE|nr:YciI family protein [Kribbella sp. NBC_01245]
MKKYMLGIYQPDGVVPPPEFLEPVMAKLEVWHDELREAGAWVFSGGLTPASSATVLRHRDGENLVTDGPFAEGKEHLGGFTIISVSDLDAAMDWGGRLAEILAPLSIEVWPMEHGSCASPDDRPAE